MKFWKLHVITAARKAKRNDTAKSDSLSAAFRDASSRTALKFLEEGKQKAVKRAAEEPTEGSV